jgi:hypothetical protein
MHEAEQPPPFQALNDIFRYTTEELCSVAAQYATSNEAAELHPAPGSREVTPNNSKEGGKKRRKQCPQWVTVTTDYNDSIHEKADGSGVGHVETTTCRGKR